MIHVILCFCALRRASHCSRTERGQKKIFHHTVDSAGQVHRYWLEAERSGHKVGGAQAETKEEKEDAIKRGKATSSVIGVKAMGTRFNVLMTIQIPLEQQKRIESRMLFKSCSDFGNVASGCSVQRESIGANPPLFGAESLSSQYQCASIGAN